MLQLRVKAWLCGGEPGAVAGGEVLVGSSSEFEFADSGWPYPEVVCASGQGEVLGSATQAQVGVVGDSDMTGEGMKDLAGDGAFEDAEGAIPTAKRFVFTCLSYRCISSPC